MSEPTPPLPPCVRTLFWDTDTTVFDARSYPEYCLERVLELGRPEAFRWALEVFGRERIREFLRTAALRRLSTHALNFWTLMLDVEDRECLVKSSLENRQRLWPYWPVRA